MNQEMRKKRKVKCPLCEEMFEKEQTISFKKRYYCQPCFEVKSKPKARTDWDELYETILYYYKEKPTPLMYKQLKDYRQNLQYTDLGMVYTLKYLFEIKKVSIKEETGLSLIPYAYQEARKYYQKCFNIQEAMSTFEWQETVRTVKPVSFSKKRDLSTFDFETIDWSEWNE